MHIRAYTDAVSAEFWPLAMDWAGQEDPVQAALEDMVTFTEEALRKADEEGLQPLITEALSLKSIDQRIAVVEQEISQVWNSALPKEEKHRQISCKKNEIALLQAGQFSFARAGFYTAA